MNAADAIRPELLGDLIAGIGALTICAVVAFLAQHRHHDDDE